MWYIVGNINDSYNMHMYYQYIKINGQSQKFLLTKYWSARYWYPYCYTQNICIHMGISYMCIGADDIVVCAC